MKLLTQNLSIIVLVSQTYDNLFHIIIYFLFFLPPSHINSAPTADSTYVLPSFLPSLNHFCFCLSLTLAFLRRVTLVASSHHSGLLHFFLFNRHRQSQLPTPRVSHHHWNLPLLYYFLFSHSSSSLSSRTSDSIARRHQISHSTLFRHFSCISSQTNGFKCFPSSFLFHLSFHLKSQLLQLTPLMSCHRCCPLVSRDLFLFIVGISTSQTPDSICFPS